MSAYIVVDLDVHDRGLLEEYRRLAVPTLAPFGLEPLARSECVEVLEGEWRPRRLVIARLPHLQAARDWHRSPQYEAAKAIRRRAATTRMVVVDGL